MKKESVIDTLDHLADWLKVNGFPGYKAPYRAIKEAIKLLKVDAVPVVRCKDCKEYRSGIDIDGNPFSSCRNVRTYGHTEPDWFCADGEKVTE